jgi:hypothetical protein
MILEQLQHFFAENGFNPGKQAVIAPYFKS